jgi:hypothetical protein
MNWRKTKDRFNLITHPQTARGAILVEMAGGERPVDTETLRNYVAKNFTASWHDAESIAQLAVENNINAVAIALLEANKVDVKHERLTDVQGQPRVYGGFVFTRKLTSGEILLKKAAEAGNTEMIRKLHGMGVPADIETVEGKGGDVFVFRDLWKSGNRQHCAAVMPVMRELYPAEAARHSTMVRAEFERTEAVARTSTP